MRLTAWQRADDLASAVFHATEHLNQRHRWLGLQLVRAAISVPANIAEGCARSTTRDYLRFVDIARSSLSEVEYYLHFLTKEKLLAEDELARVNALRAEAGRTVYALWSSLRKKLGSTPPDSAPNRWLRESREPYEVDYDSEAGP
jgi:four helix bundle protein